MKRFESAFVELVRAWRVPTQKSRRPHSRPAGSIRSAPPDSFGRGFY
jgi:hypothetical protein